MPHNMFNKLKTILAVIISPLLLASCDDLRDDYEDCGVWLEFIFDHNMEHTDSFDKSVDMVDVLVFDESGKLYSSHYATTEELLGRKRMFLGGEDMPKGKYSIVTVGGLTNHFTLSDLNGGQLVPGVTTLEQVMMALKYEEEVAHEFPHVWFGPSMEIDYRADLRVWPVPLIRQTNKFFLALERDVKNSTRAETDAPLYTFEITAPESGAYDHTNNSLVNESLLYRPHSLQSDVEPYEDGEFHHTIGKLNTMRLLSDHEGDYTLAVKDNETGEELWSHDLIDLLSMTNDRRSDDGTLLPLQEYLDRQGEWEIIIVHNGTRRPEPGGGTDGFVALQILVNGWIVWENDVEI